MAERHPRFSQVGDPMTERQKLVLVFIKCHIEAKGYPPSNADVARYFGWRSPNAAFVVLRALANKGYIVITKGISRGIKLMEVKDE